MPTKQKIMKGYKVTDSKMQCRGYQFEINKIHTQTGTLEMCENGFHFCEKAASCFNYYDFDSRNKVFEIEAIGNVLTNDDKSCCLKIKLIRELSWQEVLVLVNSGKDNTGINNSGHSNSGDRNSGDSNSGNWNSGHSNSGDSNSGNWNSGHSNSGDRNSGDRNSGDSNSGNWNSGHRNSGHRNSGNWNSGDRNSGDSNSGYRNSGAFCIDNNPELILFNKPSGIKVREWENSKPVQIMRQLLDFTLWIPDYKMTDEEKAAHPKWDTTEGYLKTISIKEAWANMWGQLTDENKAVFTSLPNFSWSIFTEITGIKEPSKP